MKIGCGGCVTIPLIGIVVVVVFSVLISPKPDGRTPPNARPEAESGQPTAGQLAEAEPVSKPTAELLQYTITPWTQPDTKQHWQRLNVVWKNTGKVPIRSVEADVVMYDESGKLIYKFEYCTYAVSDNEPGILPGETYTTPPNEGNLLQQGTVKVDVQITTVVEKDVFSLPENTTQ
jgi:hypothetical protein